jgi:RNA polymerase sigma-70 factor, ECF subfamily
MATLALLNVDSLRKNSPTTISLSKGYPVADTDQEIIEQFRAGAENIATNMLVRKYQKLVYATALRYVQSPDDALDIAQDVFIRVLKKIHDFRGESALSTWLYRITVNEAVGFLRKRKLRSFFGLETVEEYSADRAQEPDVMTENNEFEARLLEVIQELPPKQRETFCLRYFDELTYEEISDMLGTSVGGLKANYFQAIKKITAIMNVELRA